MNTRSSLLTESPATHQVREFPYVDRFGRTLGASVWTCSAVYVACATGQHYVEPGTYFLFTPHALRDGKPYGALQAAQRFSTEAERDAAVEKYFANAAKRVARNPKFMQNDDDLTAQPAEDTLGHGTGDKIDCRKQK